MKKVFIILAACAMMTACSNAGDKAVEYLDEVQAAIAEGDFARAEEITRELEEWEATLDEEEKAQVSDATKAWMMQNLNLE